MFNYKRPANTQPATASKRPTTPVDVRPAPFPLSEVPLPPLGPMVPPPVVGVFVPFETVLDSPESAAKPIAAGSYR
jgi:hypothetical protein